MTAQVAVADHACQAAFTGDGQAAEALGAHDHQRLAHGGGRVRQGDLVSAVHDVAHQAQAAAKVPAGVENSVSTEYDRLKKELEKAIELEEYEQASIIRDRMRQLKGE